MINPLSVKYLRNASFSELPHIIDFKRGVFGMKKWVPPSPRSSLKSMMRGCVASFPSTAIVALRARV